MGQLFCLTDLQSASHAPIFVAFIHESQLVIYLYIFKRPSVVVVKTLLMDSTWDFQLSANIFFPSAIIPLPSSSASTTEATGKFPFCLNCSNSFQPLENHIFLRTVSKSPIAQCHSLQAADLLRLFFDLSNLRL